MSIFYLLCLSSALRLQLHHHTVLYWDYKWSFHLHPILYYLPLSTIGYHHFFLHVVSQTTLLIASLFELAIYNVLIRLLFMFMSPWKVSVPLSMLFAMVLTFFFITGICCTWWIPKINNVFTIHMSITCHYLSSVRLWNSWKVCRLATTRWPLWPSITFITWRSLCSSVPFFTISTSNTTVNFITLGTYRTGLSFWSLCCSGGAGFKDPETQHHHFQVALVHKYLLCHPYLPEPSVHQYLLLGLYLVCVFFRTSINLIIFWSWLSCGSFNTFHSCIYFDMISTKYTD